MTRINFRNIIIIITGLIFLFANVWLMIDDSRTVLIAPAIIFSLLLLGKPFYGLLLFVSLVPLESSFLSIGGGVITGTRYLGIIVFGAWLLDVMQKRKKISFPPDLKVGLLFLIWGGVSLYWAISRGITVQRMITAGQLILLAFLIVNMVKDQKQLRAVISALFIGCFIAAFLGLIGVGVKPDSYLLTLENQGAKEYGAYVGMVFLIGSFLMIYGQIKQKILGIGFLLVTLVPLIRINQRGVLLAIVMAWAVIAFVTRQKFKMFLIIILFFVLIDFLTTFLLSTGVINTYLAERLTVQSILETGGTGRAEIWGVGWRIFLNNILSGVGWGNFPVAYPRYAYEYYTLGVSGSDPHSDLMGIGGELGVIGLLLFIIFLGRIFFKNIARVRFSDRLTRNLTVILVIALLAYSFSIGLTATFIWRKFYWIAIGLTLALKHTVFDLESNNQSTKIVDIHKK